MRRKMNIIINNSLKKLPFFTKMRVLLFYIPLCLLIILQSFHTIKAQNNPANIVHPSQTQQRKCISLKNLIIAAKKNSFREEVKKMAGLGWLEGYIVDAKNNDIILIGRQTASWPPLLLDDLAVSVRNIWKPDNSPYCSLDPREQDIQNIDRISAQIASANDLTQIRQSIQRLIKAWGPQIVKIGGVPQNSHYAHVMIDADYHMKKVSQGLLEIAELPSCLDIMVDKARSAIEKNQNCDSAEISMSRFWFHIKKEEPTFQIGNQIVCLENCTIVVLTEKQKTTAEGKLFDSGEDDPQAEEFAREFTRHFPAAAVEVEVYAELENLYRLRALLQTMKIRNDDKKAGLDLSYLMQNYKMQNETKMPLALDGKTNTKEVSGQFDRNNSTYTYTLFPLVVGGVSMEMNTEKFVFKTTQKNRMETLASAVIKSRPSPGAFSWTVNL